MISSGSGIYQARRDIRPSVSDVDRRGIAFALTDLARQPLPALAISCRDP